MAKLWLKRLECAEQEDWTGDDDIQIWVNGRNIWSGEMDEGQTRDISHVVFEFRGQARVQLKEEDWPDGDDDLGSATINDQDTVAQDLSARFTGDDANYTLWYRVFDAATPAGPNQAAQQQQGTAANAAAGAGPGGAMSPGDPAAPCPMGQLAVQVKDVDGSFIQGAWVRILERGLQMSTGADGRADFGWVLPGAVTAEAIKEGYSPYPASQQGTVAHGSQTTIELVLTRQTIIRVNPPSNRWYVNMDPDEAQRHGRQVTVTAEVSLRQPGITVYFTLERDANNRAGLPAGSQASLSAPSALTNALGIAETTLTLSTYGGDKFRVVASLSPGTSPGRGTTESGWLEVWRKLFYDVVEMRRPTSGVYEMKAAILTRVRAGMADAYIELVDTGARHVGNYVRNFETVEAGFVWADGYTSNTGVPQKIHFAVIDSACPGSGTYGPTQTFIQENATQTPFDSTGTIFPHDFSGANWIVQAVYYDGTNWQNFAAGKVTLLGARGTRKIHVDFAGATVTPSNAHPVPFRVTYRQAFGAGGWGGSNALHLLICRGLYEDGRTVAEADAQIIVACIHEPGHAMGLVSAAKAWHDGVNTSHCTVRNCAMWFQSTPGNERFHVNGCRDDLRGQDLSRTAMQPNWKFPR